MWILRNLTEDHGGREGEEIVTNREGGRQTIKDSFFIYNFIYFWDRERAWAGEGPRGRHRIQSRLWGVSIEPDVGLEPTDCEIMTWAEVGRSTNWATQVSPKCLWILEGTAIFAWQHCDWLTFCLDAEGLGIIIPGGPFVKCFHCTFSSSQKPSMAPYCQWI